MKTPEEIAKYLVQHLPSQPEQPRLSCGLVPLLAAIAQAIQAERAKLDAANKVISAAKAMRDDLLKVVDCPWERFEKFDKALESL